jgi:uncharacterized protein YigA (DUF484 family)
MDEMSETIRKNREISEKFSRIEASLASYTHAKDLLETVLMQLQYEFDIPFVWISMINRPDLDGLVRVLQSSNLMNDRVNLIDEDLFLNLVAGSTKPVLANRDLQPFYRLFPKNKKYFIKSIAVAPITLHGHIIGSINHGDAANMRYEPDLDTSLLQQLVGSLSSCLSRLLPPDPVEANR